MIVLQTNTFIANYQGEPFMQSMFKNKWMVRLSFLIIGLAFCVIFDLSPDLTVSLELLPLPDDSLYRIYFFGILVGDFIICFIFENWKKILGYYK